jgi:hypothetical protein
MTIDEIVAGAKAALAAPVWPAHPNDDEVTEMDAASLFLGAAGLVWGLRRLGVDVEHKLRVPDDAPPALLIGEAGILVVTRADDARLQQLVDENERNPFWEVMSGSPGMILAAKATGLEWRRSAEILAEEWERSGGLWTQDLWGHTGQVLGPVHGFAGNVHALRGFLDNDILRRRVERVLREHAIWDGDAVNWPPAIGDAKIRVQWCHGAPGILITLGDLMPEDLMLGAAETTWRTGPLEKGQGLCHGTAGNGYALLKAFALTGDDRWLERAQTFADAALAQCDGRYSLFTGDIGAALFARACDERDARFPIMDVL